MRYDWLTVVRGGPRGFLLSCLKNDRTCGITAAGIKTFSLVDVMATRGTYGGTSNKGISKSTGRGKKMKTGRETLKV
jgi:hypothetical protein